MKKVITMVAILLIISTASANALTKALTVTPKITFSGNTANCYVLIRDSGKNISATMNLYEGGNLVDTWSKSGSSSVTLSGSHTAKSGKTYKLVVNYTINGGSTQTVTTTKTCP